MNRAEQILKREMRLSKKTKVRIGIAVSFFCILSVIFCFFIYRATKKTLNAMATQSITNISRLNKDSVSRAIDNRNTLMETLADRLGRKGIEEPQEILAELTDFRENYRFAKMGFLNKEGEVYLTDGSVMEASKLALPEDIWDGSSHITESRPFYVGDDYMSNTFSSPVIRDGQIQYVLVATCYSFYLTERMDTSYMDGKGHTFLLDAQGKVVLYPHHYNNEEYNELMEYISKTPEIRPKGVGDYYFVYGGERYFAHVEELGINDWFLLTCLRELDVFEEGRSIITAVYLVAGVLWLIIFLLIGVTVYSIHQNRADQVKKMYYDKLLGIPNRDALSLVYAKLPKQALTELYLSVFDIDRFKEFNYIYGDEKGDSLLKYIAQTLLEMDSELYLFRYVSDCFIALNTGKDREDLERKMDAALKRFGEDVEAGLMPPFDISAGIRKIRPAESLRFVISDALVARDGVKGNHLNSYAFYDEEIRQKRLSYMKLQSAFPTALRDGEIHVYYQPKVDMYTGEIIGVEALARWINKDGKMIVPGDFIPCLEASRQIIQLDEEILRQVCVQMREMEEEGLPVCPVSVNLSRVHLRNPGILPKIEEIIRSNQVDPAKLSFEITETVFFEDSIPLNAIVEYLHALGCRVEMDDYGVGVSGPNSLASNSFDAVKLDKSLTDGIDNEKVEDVIRSTVQMVRKWGMDILIEGVEEKEQAKRLMELGCFCAQGYYFYKPMPESKYRELLRRTSKR